MEVKTIVQKVSKISAEKLCLTARDETGGITRFGFGAQNGVPNIGDEISLCYPRTHAGKLVGIRWNGQMFRCGEGVA